MSEHREPSAEEIQRESFDILCVDAIDLVTEYLDDALSANDLARFRAHLSGCDGCTLYVNQLEMTIELANATGSRRIDLMPRNFDLLLAQLRGKR